MKREAGRRLTESTQRSNPDLGMIFSTEQLTGTEITPIKPHTTRNAMVTLAAYVTLGMRPKTAERRTSIEHLDKTSAT